MAIATIAAIDYDMGNLHSARKGLEQAGAAVTVVTHPHDLDRYDGILLPGVGAFDPAMRSLRERGFEAPLHAAVARRQPLLGICLGMQLLCDGSDEGVEPGLQIVPGRVQRFRPEPGITVPHMGWNQLDLTQPDLLLWQDIDPHPWAYFVHSYYVVPSDSSWNAATVTHGSQTVTASIARDRIMATQFHPEKSASAGLQIIANFVRLCTHQAQQLAEVG